jgi:hypothetical protein
MEEAKTMKVLNYLFIAKYCITVNNYKARALVLHTTSSSYSLAALLPIISQIFFLFGYYTLQADIAPFSTLARQVSLPFF